MASDITAPDRDRSMNAVREPDPQERMESIQMDMRSEASSKENAARDLEDRVLQLRAEAAGLRAGAEGLESAINVYNHERARAQEFRAGRDEREGNDKPMPAPYMSQQGPGYDARAHANRLP